MNTTLTSVFEAGRASLETKLGGLSLPQDSEKIQRIIEQSFAELIGPNSNFRMTLTVAENAIIQHAIGLMNIRHQLSAQILPKQETADNKMRVEAMPADTSSPLFSIVGSAIGGSVGALIGPWPAVIGAVAGTAVGTYYREFMPKAAKPESESDVASSEPEATTISVSAMTDIIHSICKQIDLLLATYRQQIADLKASYDNREKVTLSRNYQFLLESIQSVLGASYSTETEKEIGRLKDRCEQLGESLENYGLRAVVYSVEKVAHLFEINESENCASPATRLPAIMEGDKIILKGKAVLPIK